MTFHLDEDQSPKTVRAAWQLYALDVTSSHELGLDPASDEEQLLHAGREDRCLVTGNGRDFFALTSVFEAEQLAHAGVLIVPRSLPGNARIRIARALAWCHALYTLMVCRRTSWGICKTHRAIGP